MNWKLGYYFYNTLIRIEWVFYFKWWETLKSSCIPVVHIEVLTQLVRFQEGINFNSYAVCIFITRITRIPPPPPPLLDSRRKCNHTQCTRYPPTHLSFPFPLFCPYVTVIYVFIILALLNIVPLPSQ